MSAQPDAGNAAPASPTPAASSAPAHVLIVGAGPAGLALACALADAGLHSTVLEQAPLADLVDPPEDGRDIALTHRARRILQALGLWARLPADEIALLKQAHVSSGTSPLVLPFDAREDGHDNLGWLVPNHRIRAACHAGAQARADRVTLVGDARVVALDRWPQGASVTLADGRRFEAPLVVAADSRFSGVRKLAGIGAHMHDFGRTAIVCRMAHEREHDGVAHECFLNSHTLAILPMAGRQASAVWTVASDGVAALQALSDEAFAQTVASEFGHKLGAMHTAGQRHAYPLVAVYAERFWAPRLALIGDAAVGMHPVTAHGYNFGLYGIEVLARELAVAHRAGRDLGDSTALQAYAREHRRTTLPIFLGTNAIVKLFTTDRPAAHLVRGAVLRASTHLPPLKAAITRQLTGQGGLPWPGWLSRLPRPRRLVA